MLFRYNVSCILHYNVFFARGKVFLYRLQWKFLFLGVSTIFLVFFAIITAIVVARYPLFFCHGPVLPWIVYYGDTAGPKAFSHYNPIILDSTTTTL